MGPAGTEESDYNISFYSNFWFNKGELAESWEFEGDDTVIYHIRKGVHFSYNPKLEASQLVGGREFTADDAVYNIRRNYIDQKTSGAYFLALADAPVDAYATDKWTVVVKTPPGHQYFTHRFVCQCIKHYAHEVIEKYGSSVDWSNVVGTGPFMMDSCVPNSSYRFVKNPTFWEKDPYIQGNQLPYIDTVKILVIPDASTRLAAIRTCQADRYTGVTWEQLAELEGTNPELQSRKYLGLCMMPSYRLDKPELPFTDINVRRALMMGINYQELIDEYYQGNAVIYQYPIASFQKKEWSKAYTPLEELGLAPDGFDTKEIYEYNPEEAKKLLAKAGYPDGFKCEMVVTQRNADFISMLKAYWDKIGVDLSLDLVEQSVSSHLTNKKTYNQMISTAWPSNGVAGTFEIVRQGGYFNFSRVSDPIIDEGYLEICKAVPWSDEWYQLVKKLAAYQTHQVYYCDVPTEFLNVIWQPWLKRYHGEMNVIEFEHNGWLQYAWIDQELKKEMGY